MTVTGRKLDYAFGAVLTNAAEASALDRLTFGGSTCIRIPRSILSALVIDIDDIAMRPIPDEVNTLNLLTGYANALLTDAPLASPPELRHLIVSQVTDLVALTASGSEQPPRSLLPENLWQHAPRYQTCGRKLQTPQLILRRSVRSWYDVVPACQEPLANLIRVPPHSFAM